MEKPSEHPIAALSAQRTREFPPKLLLTVEEAARLLSIGRPKMWQLVMTGAVLSVKIGASRRIPATALDAYIRHLTAVALSATAQELSA